MIAENPRRSEQPKPSFNWQAYVAQNTPGSGSELQRKRQEVMIGVIPELTRWYARYDFLEEFGGRLKPGAYYGSVSMQDVPGALLVAKYSGWLFALDELTDKGGAAVEPPSFALHWLRWRLQSPLLRGRSRFLGQLFSGLSSAFLSVLFFREKKEQPALAERLARSWEDISQELSAQSHKAPSHFSLRTFALETGEVVKAMAWEREQGLRFNDVGRCPSLEEYLETARYSICLRAAASLALAFEEVPEEAWAKWQRAMDAGARVLRLTNDLSNIHKEFEEGKPNAVSITLRNLGWDGQTLPSVNRRLLDEALRLVRERRALELERFNAEIQHLPPEGPLALNVYSSVAFTIAMYQDGDYVIPNNKSEVA